MLGRSLSAIAQSVFFDVVEHVWIKDADLLNLVIVMKKPAAGLAHGLRAVIFCHHTG